jgi:hypothetical protein
VIDTDILVDALRGFGSGLAYVEDAEQQGRLRISITTEMELIVNWLRVLLISLAS